MFARNRVPRKKENKKGLNEEERYVNNGSILPSEKVSFSFVRLLRIVWAQSRIFRCVL